MTSEDLNSARVRYENARERALPYQLFKHFRIVVFGSSRLDSTSTEFRFVSQLTKALVEARDIDIVTGGGPGIMEAAHYGGSLAIAGARDEGRELSSRNHGVTIDLPFAEPPNEHLTHESRHQEFSTRPQDCVDITQAAYCAPGGMGTLLELAFLLQLRQVGHLEPDYPIIAHPFWKPVIEIMNN